MNGSLLLSPHIVNTADEVERTISLLNSIILFEF
jgi:selenocysteine lyase/cysteine desulfurase